MLEDHDGVGIGERRREHAPRIVDGGRCDHRDSGNVRVPALEAVRVLGGELAAGAGGHSDHQRNVKLPARHVSVERRRVDDLVEREQAEVHRHHLDDRTHPTQRGTDAGADERELGERRVADALGTELVEEALRHRVRTAVLSDVLAHQEDARIARERVVKRLACRFAVGDLHRAGSA